MRIKQLNAAGVMVWGMVMGCTLMPAVSIRADTADEWKVGNAWRRQADGWSYSGKRVEHAYSVDAVFSADVDVEAVLKVGEALAPGWKTAGVSVFQDARNYWALQLVETPQSAPNQARLIQLMVMRHGLWGAQNQAGATKLQRTRHDVTASWHPGRAYRMRLAMDAEGVRGTVLAVDSETVIADIAYAFDTEADAVVSGRPGLIADGFQASFRDVVSASGAPYAPPPRSVRNWLENPGFERGMEGWKWDTQQGGRAVGAVVTSESHGGAASFHLAHDASGRPVSRVFTTVKGLFPETRYAFSAWIKGRNGRGFVGGREDWSVRERYRATDTWQKVTAHYRTRPGETEFMFMVVLEGTDMEVWIDSLEVALQENDDLPRLYAPKRIETAMESQEKAAGIFLRGSPSRVSEHDVVEGRFTQSSLTERLPEAEAVFSVRDAKRERVSEIGVVTLPAIDRGQSRQVAFLLPAEPFSPGLTQIEARLPDGTFSVTLERFSFVEETQAATDRALAEATALMNDVKARLGAHPELARDSHVTMGMQIASRYIRRARAGGPGGRQGLWQQWRDNPVAARRDTALWNLLQAEESAAVLRDVLERIDRIVAETEQIWIAPPLTEMPEGSAIVGMDVTPDTSRSDFAFLRKAGIRLVQREQGPNTWTKEGEWKGRKTLMQWMSDADAAGMKVDLLISPHYFPRWLYDEHPDAELKGERFFIQFQIDHPETRKVVERHIRHVVEQAAQHDSLHSICLSNEPLWNTSGRDPWSRPAWTAYLRERHGGNLDALNALYGTEYASFGEVPAYAINPWSGKAPEDEGKRRWFYDWTRFNNKNFADWHRWMHDIVKAVAPHIPTHSKIMAGFLFTQGRQHHGFDPELFCRTTDIAGCDTGSGSVRASMLYNLLHSFRGQAVFNSEDHLTGDGSPPISTCFDTVYAATFQPVIHHRMMNAFWIWTEPVARHLAGHVTLRPANLYATGKAAFDLLRLHEEVSALREVPADVALLFSPTSIFWQPAYERCVLATYEALVYSGASVTFISERQLLEGLPPPAPTILVPYATHTLDGVSARLAEWARMGTAITKVGAKSLQFDEYNRPVQPCDETWCLTLPWQASAQAERESVRAGGVEVEQEPEPLTEEGHVFRDRLLEVLPGFGELFSFREISSGNRVWEVEFRGVRQDGKTLVFLMNHADVDQVGSLDPRGDAVDLIQGIPVSMERIELRPRQIMLLKQTP